MCWIALRNPVADKALMHNLDIVQPPGAEPEVQRLSTVVVDVWSGVSLLMIPVQAEADAGIDTRRPMAIAATTTAPRPPDRRF